MRCLLALLLLTSQARGQDPVRLVIKGDTEIVEIDRTIITVVKDKRELVKKLPFTIECPSDAFRPHWSVPAGVTYTTKGRILTITGAPSGELKIDADWGVIKTGEELYGTVTFNVGDVPQPKPPKPPEPPKPPVPEPKPPVPVAGLRVLVVAESTQGGLLLSAKQSNELWGQTLADYANAKFAKGPKGMPELLRLDKDIDPTKMNDVWRQFFADWQRNANGVVPWIVVSNGDRGYSGPLPDGGGAILELIRRYEQ